MSNKPQVSLEELSQAELIKKYKNVLLIAQRAKQARDEAVKQLNCLKEGKSNECHAEMILKESHESITKELKNINENLEKELQLFKNETCGVINSTSKIPGAVLLTLMSQLGDLKREHSKTKIEVISYCDIFKHSLIPEVLKYINSMKEIDFSKHPIEIDDWKSDTLSTSTIGQMEENSRLKDIEGSFEEYNQKLKMFALKQKKKINMLTSEVEVLEQDRLTMKLERDSLKKKIENLQKENDKLAGHARNFQSLQAEYDKMVDRLEIESKSKKGIENRLQEMATVRAEAANLKEKLDNLQSSYIHAEKDKELLKEELSTVKTENSRLQALLSDEMKKSLNLSESVTALEAEVSSRKTLEIDHKQKHDLLLEEREKTHMNMIREKNQEIDNCRKIEIELQSKVTHYQTQIESLNQKCDELNISLSQELVAKEKCLENLNSCQANSKRQTASLENRIQDLMNQLSLSQSDLSNVRQDFDNYKVRVHCVLKQQQNDTQQEQLDEDKEEVKKELDVMKETVVKLQAQVQHLEDELSEAKHLVSKSDLANELLKKKLHEKELSLLSQVQSKNDSLKQTTEALKKCQLDNKLLISSYKNQIDILKNDHQEAIGKLENQIVQLKQDLMASREVTEMEEEKVKRLEDSVATEDRDTIAVMNMPREQGEGSECTNDVSISSPLPLEKLLDKDLDTEEWVNSEKVEELESKYLESEKRLQHMTYLLHEAEANNARLSELAEALKEEIRRSQRNQEREKHLENLEYLKNVVHKFITLSSSDEKLRLVPVLNTMLKLSPEEKRDFIAIADGSAPHKAMGKEGWSSYFPLWSTNNK